MQEGWIDFFRRVVGTETIVEIKGNHMGEEGATKKIEVYRMISFVLHR